MHWMRVICTAVIWGALAPVAFAQSTCRGTTNNGSVENAVALPREGKNFVRMSQGPVSATRVFVHSIVGEVVQSAYASLASTHPDIRWVYGETGFAQGGPIPPHKTHQNGTSVDLFVPVLDKEEKSTAFPLSLENGFGYKVSFDARGNNASHSIDFAALGDLLFALQVEGQKRGAPLKLVVFQKELRGPLFSSPRGAWLSTNIPFPSWDDSVRHDNHIHVDFDVKCQ